MDKKIERKEWASEEYLSKIFSLLKRREELSLTSDDSLFNNTELCVISEICIAKSQGKRLISTQLAKRLGVTRSAISQIVNRLETRGVVCRVDDEVDRKIAYIEITDAFQDTCGEMVKQAMENANKIIKKFGEEKFERMCKQYEEFISTVKKITEKE